MVIGMYYHMFPPKGEPEKATCTCSWIKNEMDDGATCAA
jgi:hypothetical protein